MEPRFTLRLGQRQGHLGKVRRNARSGHLKPGSSAWPENIRYIRIESASVLPVVIRSSAFMSNLRWIIAEGPRDHKRVKDALLSFGHVDG